jgi:hypothetical protein
MSADLIVFGEDWASHPSSTQHLIANLPGQRRIVWANSIGLRSPRLNAADAGRVVRKVGRALHLTKPPARPAAPVEETRAEGRAPDKIVQPLVLPMARSAPLRALNRALLARSVGRAAQAAGLRRPVLWTSLPSAADAIGALDEAAVVYYCGDDFGALAGVDHAAARAFEDEIAARADLILASSPLLAARFPAAKTHLLPHGVDFARFATPAPRALDLPAGRPVAGFYGALAPWIDTGLIAATAHLLPEWAFVLVGPEQSDVSALRACPNVSLPGPRPHSALPGYAQHWTAGLIPFHDNAQIRASNPLKLPEYLAAGQPIVATEFPALDAYRAHISVCATPAQFAAALQAARTPDPEAAARRRASVAGESWAARAAEVAALIDALAR